MESDHARTNPVTAGRIWPWLGLLSALIATVLLRLRLLGVPLERDEGGFAYMGQLILDGVPPFAQAYDMKMPGIHYLYAGILFFFGQTVHGIHTGLLLFNAATVVLIFLLGRRLLGDLAGVAAAVCFAVSSASATVLGFTANCEPFLVFLAVAGMLMALRAIDSGKPAQFFAGGFFVGLALTVKHQGLFFVLFVAVYLAISAWRRRRTAHPVSRYLLFGLGCSLPLVALLVFFSIHGLLGKLWFWLVDYTWTHGTTLATPADGRFLLKLRVGQMAGSFLPLWIVALAGLCGVLLRSKQRVRAPFMLLLFLCSFLAVALGYRFFPHYFVLLLPALALFFGAGVVLIDDLISRGVRRYARAVSWAVLLLSPAFLVYAERNYFFGMDPDEISRRVYGERLPFPESVEVGHYIQRHTAPGDRIAVIGSEPQICFYARRRSATRHIYLYPLMGEHPAAEEMQLEMIRDIEQARPAYVVFVGFRTSWWQTETSPKRIFEWTSGDMLRDYLTVGVADVVSSDRTVYVWDESGVRYTPESGRFLAVLKRKDTSSAPPGS